MLLESTSFLAFNSKMGEEKIWFRKHFYVNCFCVILCYCVNMKCVLWAYTWTWFAAGGAVLRHFGCVTESESMRVLAWLILLFWVSLPWWDVLLLWLYPFGRLFPSKLWAKRNPSSLCCFCEVIWQNDYRANMLRECKSIA